MKETRETGAGEDARGLPTVGFSNYNMNMRRKLILHQTFKLTGTYLKL